MVIARHDPSEPGPAAGKLTIDAACPNDLGSILELEEASFTPAQRWTRISWESELSGAAMRTLVARQVDRYGRGELIGVIAVRLLSDQADVDRVMVSGAARRRGIGRQLVTAGIAEASRSEASEMILEVAQHNQAAIGLYEELGFTVVSSRRDYYGSEDDAMIMKRMLS